MLDVVPVQYRLDQLEIVGARRAQSIYVRPHVKRRRILSGPNEKTPASRGPSRLHYNYYKLNRLAAFKVVRQCPGMRRSNKSIHGFLDCCSLLTLRIECKNDEHACYFGRTKSVSFTRKKSIGWYELQEENFILV